MSRARGANALMAGVFENTYGTTPGSGFVRLPFVSCNLGAEQALTPSDILGDGREPQDPDLDSLNNDGSIMAPVDARNIGFWLKLLAGAPSTTEDTGVYTHVFSSGATALPSASIEVGSPEVPSYALHKGVMANSMAIRLQRSGLLTAELQLIAQNEALATSSGAGTPTEHEVIRFPQRLGEIKKDDTALGSVVSADFTLSNGLDKVEVIRKDGLIEGADPGMVSARGNITVRFASTALLTQATAGTPCSISFGWEKDADNSLLIELPRVFLPRAKRPIEGPGGIQVSFPFEASRDTSSGKTWTATLINDVASY